MILIIVASTTSFCSRPQILTLKMMKMIVFYLIFTLK